MADSEQWIETLTNTIHEIRDKTNDPEIIELCNQVLCDGA